MKRGTKGSGSIRKTAAGFIFRLRIDNTEYTKTITDPVTGKRPTTIREAQTLRPTIEKIVRAQAALARGTDGNIPLTRIWDAYTQALTLTRKRGTRHVDAEKATPLAPATMRLNHVALEQFLDHAQAKGAKTLGDINAKVAADYASNLRRERGESTFTRYVAALRRIFNVISTKAVNPFAGIELPTPTELAQESAGHAIFSAGELALLEVESRGSYWRPMIAIALATGLRLGDICHLRRDGVEYDGGEDIYVTAVARKTGKPVATFGRGIQNHIRDWIADGGAGDEFLFPEPKGIYVNDISALTKRFSRLLRRCGIPERDDSGGKKAFHSLRATAATDWRRQGASRAAVRETLGHSTDALTDGYTKLTAAEIKQEARTRLLTTEATTDTAKAQALDIVAALTIEATIKEKLLLLIKNI